MLPSGMAFYLMFALVPSLTLLVLFFQLFDVPGDFLQSYLLIIFPKSIALNLIDFLSNGHSWTGFFVIALNVIISLSIVANGFNAFIVASNSIYKKKKTLVNRRMRSYALATIFVLGLFLYFFANSFLSFYIKNDALALFVRLVLMLLIIFLMTMMLYSIAGTKFDFGKVWIGSAIATVGITVIITFFALYSKYFSRLSRNYGPLSWLLVMMLGLYLIGMCLHIGLLINAMFVEELEERFRTQQQKIIIPSDTMVTKDNEELNKSK